MGTPYRGVDAGIKHCLHSADVVSFGNRVEERLRHVTRTLLVETIGFQYRETAPTSSQLPWQRYQSNRARETMTDAGDRNAKLEDKAA